MSQKSIADAVDSFFAEAFGIEVRFVQDGEELNLAGADPDRLAECLAEQGISSRGRVVTLSEDRWDQ